ncbi:MAG TPA: hypothetical protein VI168_11030 [Croceibacterium sp.]
MPLLGLAAALGVAGVAVLRFAWSLPRRSVPWNAAGWGLLLAAAIGAALAEGAWGVSVASLLAMGAATIALAEAGARAPRGRAAASNRRVGMLPEAGEPRQIGRRIGTFALVILAGSAVSVGLATAMRGLGGLLGWHAANANALALFTVPVAWAVLCTVLLMQTRRRSQFLTLGLCSLPLVPVLLTGALQ